MVTTAPKKQRHAVACRIFVSQTKLLKAWYTVTTGPKY